MARLGLLGQSGSGFSDEDLIVLIALFAVSVVMLAIQIVAYGIVFFCALSIPPRLRELPPGMVWLLLIPCFSLFWNFVVFLKISDGFAKCFAECGISDNGDCGRQAANWYCLCSVLSVIPFVNYVTSPASLVFLLIVLLKFGAYSWQVREAIRHGALGYDRPSKGTRMPAQAYPLPAGDSPKSDARRA